MEASQNPTAQDKNSKTPTEASTPRLDNVVGLFGTCGNSTWREAVMKRFDEHGVKYFNPQVREWTPECKTRESYHLTHDKVVLFAITGETEGYASLGETGWSELSARMNNQRAIFCIEDFKENGVVNPKHPANRTRTLVRSHAETLGVKIYSNLEEAVNEAEHLVLTA